MPGHDGPECCTFALKSSSQQRCAQPLWSLLASTNGPTVLGLLQCHLYDNERSLPASILHERIGRELERLRNLGEDWPKTAQQYVAGWLADDFRRVRDQFEHLSRDLRERIMEDDGHRGDVLDTLFAGIDLISGSEAGRTYG